MRLPLLGRTRRTRISNADCRLFGGLFPDITLLSFAMGYLSEKVFNQVDRLSRERGRSYFVGGAVKRIEGDAWRVDARVQGSHLYGVRIAFADDFLEVNCSCPFFDRDLVTCKHIWAAVLAAEREGFLKGPASRAELDLIETYDGDDEFADEIGQDRRPPKEAPPPPPRRAHTDAPRGRARGGGRAAS